MNIQLNEKFIPGTVLNRNKMGDMTGLNFLKKIFYITDGIMLSQIREIAGIDGSTLQNWTKRGWVKSSKHKRYDVEQLAHILIINMLRSCLQLDRIAFILRYINGNDRYGNDAIIKYSVLYDYICRILDHFDAGAEAITLKNCITQVTSEYEEKVTGAKRRLDTALEIIVTTYYASVVKKSANDMLEAIIKKR